MPRIRTIKPEIWADEKFGPLSPLTKLVYVGLISQADDAGRVLDSVRLIDGTLFPYDDSTTCRGSLDDLSSARLIARGRTRAGQPVIQIVGWASHQKIDKPNLKACLAPIASNSAGSEGFDDTSTTDRRHVDDASALHTNDHVPTTYDQRPTSVEQDALTLAKVRGLYGYGDQEGMDPVLLKAFDDPEARDRCVDIALARLGAEGEPYTGKFFRAILTSVIAEQSSNGSDPSIWED